jgi:DNA end-binding protein Ku
MTDKDRVALARIVMTNREHVIAIEPFDKGMLATTLRYPYEIHDAADYFRDIPTPRVTRDMVKLAEHILATKAGKFNPSNFKDEYETALKALVKRKAAGKAIKPVEQPAREGNVIDLMDALKRSLKPGSKTQPGKKRPQKPRRRHAA